MKARTKLASAVAVTAVATTLVSAITSSTATPAGSNAAPPAGPTLAEQFPALAAEGAAPSASEVSALRELAGSKRNENGAPIAADLNVAAGRVLVDDAQHGRLALIPSTNDTSYCYRATLPATAGTVGSVAASCSPSLPASGIVVNAGVHSSSPRYSIWGLAPKGIARVELTFASGETVNVVPERGVYYWNSASVADSAPLSLRALTASGTAIHSEDLGYLTEPVLAPADQG